MNGTMRAAIATIVVLMLSGCATGMSKKECLYADWRAIGYEDGAAGRDASTMAGRRTSCADKAKVTPDMTAYMQGREAGLDEFCRPASGYQFGASGYRYAGACAGRDEGAFVAAYQEGLTLYGLVSNLDAASRALAAAHADLDNLDRQITYAQAAIVNPATPHPARIDHLAEMKAMMDRRDKVRDAIADLARDVDDAEDELAAYRREVSDRSYANGATQATAARF